MHLSGALLLLTFLVPPGWALDAYGAAPAGDPSADAPFVIILAVVFGSILAFTAYIYLLNRVRPALATSYAYVNPPIAVLFGVLLAGERFGAMEAAAMAVILAGVVVILSAGKS
jgi:drug/metabolite transporter (DMT)-like permease